MKKILVALLLAVCLMLSSCGNMALGFGTFTFKGIHIDTPHHSGCYTIIEWHDNETGIEVKTEEIGTIYISEGTPYLLYESVCPFCSTPSEAE